MKKSSNPAPTTAYDSYHKPNWVRDAQGLRFLDKGVPDRGHDTIRTHDPRHGGVKARAWRQKVARLATTAPAEKLRTLKFPLADSQNIDRQEAFRLYDITEGVGKGTLIGLLTALHLAGFRVFQSKGEAKEYRKNPVGIHDQALREFFSTHYGLTLEGKGLSFMQSIAISLPKLQDRGVFGSDTLSNLLCKRMSGKGLKTQKDDNIKHFCTTLASAMEAHFKGWEALENQRDVVLQWFVGHFRAKDASFPDIASSTVEVPAGDMPIAFDPQKAAHLVHISDEDLAVYGLHLVVALCLPEPKLKEAIVSLNNNAISWLFGAGLEYLQKITCDRLMADLGVPEERRPAISRLLDYARSLPTPIPLFGHKHYVAFRQSTAGKVSSWVANYHKRLDDLHAFYEEGEKTQAFLTDLFTLRGEWASNQLLQGLFRGLEDDWEVVAEAHNNYAQLRKRGFEASKKLLGEQAGAGVEDASTLQKTGDTLDAWAGAIEKLRGRIGQYLEEEVGEPLPTSIVDQLKRINKADIALPKAFPKISGGTAELAEYGDRAVVRLNDLIAAQDYFVVQAEGLKTIDVLQQLEQRERHNGAASSRTQGWGDGEWQMLAAQAFLHNVANLLKRLEGEEEQKCLRDLLRRWDVLADGNSPSSARKLDKLYNGWLINRKGKVYVSPWSNRRHDAYRLRQDCWHNATWLEDMAAITRSFAARLSTLEGEVLARATRNWMEYRNFMLKWVVNADQGSVKTGVLPPSLKTISGISEPQIAALGRTEISNAELKRIVNLMQSEIGKVRYGLLRSEVMVRTKFSFTGEKDLLYTVKPSRSWQMPERYRDAYPVLASPALSKVLPPGVAVDSAALHKALPLLLKEETQQALNLLKQFPHDWHLPWKLQTDQKPPLEGLAFSGREFPKKVGKHHSLGRLTGPPALKGALEKIMFGEVGGRGAKCGDLTLLIDFVFQQKMSFSPEMGFRVEQISGQQKLELAVPLTEYLSDETLTHSSFFDRLIAFDQGERFISYAVFDIREYLNSGAPALPAVDAMGHALVGKVAIPAVLHLRQTVNRSRHKQATQKITDRYSRAMEKRREAAVGEISQRIERLCAKYRAFPVLESQLDAFETGGNRLKVVYGSLLHLYAYSGIDAHKNQRSHHWYGAEKWQHPYLHVHKYEAAEDGGKQTEKGKGSKKPRKSAVAPLNLFPGTTVHPAGTSKTCVFCRRDPISALYRWFESHKKMTVLEDGVCTLKNGDTADGSIAIKQRGKHRYSAEEKGKARKNNRRGGLNVVLKAGEYERDALMRDARATLRQEGLLLNQADTTQSRYQCLYTDCGQTYHADEGAAINIGRRFLQEKVECQASQTALQAINDKP